MTKMKIYLLSACIALLSWGCEDDHVSGDGWSVIYPDGREAFVKGTTANLVWKASSSSVLRIELYRKLIERISGYTDKPYLYLCMESDDVWDSVFGWKPESSDELESVFSDKLRKSFF